VRKSELIRDRDDLAFRSEDRPAGQSLGDAESEGAERDDALRARHVECPAYGHVAPQVQTAVQAMRVPTARMVVFAV
jgi:hypothetical protein